MMPLVEFAFLGDPRPRVRELLQVRRSFLAAMTRMVREGEISWGLFQGLIQAVQAVDYELAGLRGWGHA